MESGSATKLLIWLVHHHRRPAPPVLRYIWWAEAAWCGAKPRLSWDCGQCGHFPRSGPFLQEVRCSGP